MLNCLEKIGFVKNRIVSHTLYYIIALLCEYSVKDFVTVIFLNSVYILKDSMSPTFRRKKNDEADNAR